MTSDKNSLNDVCDEQFCELLMGRAADEMRAVHPDAEAEAVALRSALSSYRTESLLWAERRSSAMPSLIPAARRKGFLAAVPQWSLAAVAAMTVAIGVVHFNSTPQETAAVDAAADITRSVDAVAATPQQIDDDNALLSSIDAAVNAGSGLPVTALGLSPSHAAGRTRGSME